MEKSELSKAWSIDPRERIKALSELASGSVSISNGIPIKRYYRSGVELERMVCNNSKIVACFSCSKFLLL